MQPAYNLAKKVADTDITVLLQGETGTGKDVMAKQIHRLSKRKDGPFITLDCGLVAHNLAESELYGHRKGAFSGASERKMGLVEKAITERFSWMKLEISISNCKKNSFDVSKRGDSAGSAKLRNHRWIRASFWRPT